MRNVWNILGISPTENKRVIKKAYAAKLAQYHPEDYPEEFKEIQAAYTSIMDSISRDYKNDTVVRSDLKDAFKKKDTFYYEEPEPLPSPSQDRNYFDDEQEHYEGTSKKQKDTSLYTELDLDWSFQEADNNKTKKTKTTKEVEYTLESTTSTQEGTPPYKKDLTQEVLSNLYYKKFLEQIRFQKSIETFENLILNEAFFKQMGDPCFYKNISQTIVPLIPTLNPVILSFLYDSFSVIKENYNYPRETFEVPNAIRNYQIDKVAQEKRSRFFRCFGIPSILILLYIFYFIGTVNDKKQEKVDQEKADKVYTEFKDMQENNKRKAINSLNQTLKDTYQVSYTCNFTFNFTGFNSSYLYTCSYDGNTYMGNVHYDSDGNITDLTQPQQTNSDAEETSE